MLKSKQDAMKDVGKVQNHKIEIQKQTGTGTDSVGNEIEIWVTWKYFWIEANGLWGTEYYAAACQHQENTVELTLRNCEDLKLINTLEYRIIFNNKTYDIKNIDNVKYEDTWIKLKILERGINGS